MRETILVVDSLLLVMVEGLENGVGLSSIAAVVVKGTGGGNVDEGLIQHPDICTGRVQGII